MYFCRLFALSALLLHGAGTEAELIDSEPEVELFSAHLGPRYFARSPFYGALLFFNLWWVNDGPASLTCFASFAHESLSYSDLKYGVANAARTTFRLDTHFNSGLYFHFDSQAYRRIDRYQAKNPNCNNSYRACLRLSSISVGILHNHNSPTSVVCLSEMPMFKQLVINTKTDQLGDHD
ncbi:hypothetical protein, partial [Endozoicomonas numazuensis]|uniref:hypothetical protein n=1 Tax=Endozoicomonas numazuensis TaxID=1137799 RepID=UPI00054D0625